MISVWTNTEELLVLESKEGSLKARGYIAKWDEMNRDGGYRPSVNVRDNKTSRRVYYSIRLEIEAGGHILRNYGEGDDGKQSYFANQKNALKALQAMFTDVGISCSVIKEGNKLGMHRRKKPFNPDDWVCP